MMSLFMNKEVIDEWTEHSKVGKDSAFRAQYIDGKIEIQFYDGEIWLHYRTDSTIQQIITRLYEENRQLQNDAEYSHHDAESI